GSRRDARLSREWSSEGCSSDLLPLHRSDRPFHARCARSPVTGSAGGPRSRGAAALPKARNRRCGCIGTPAAPEVRTHPRIIRTMTSTASELIELLSLERLEDTLFRGQSRDIGTKYVFGGQVLGQALSAAQATLTEPRAAHSLHAYFLRAGDIEHPIVYDVDRTRDGGSFSVRRVSASQHGKVIFFCAASFQQEETGAEHQLSMPEVPRPEDIEPAPLLPPEKLAALPIKVQRWLDRMGPFEFRHVYPRDEL